MSYYLSVIHLPWEIVAFSHAALVWKGRKSQELCDFHLCECFGGNKIVSFYVRMCVSVLKSLVPIFFAKRLQRTNEIEKQCCGRY